MHSALPDRLISVPAKDHMPKNCNVSDVLKPQNRKQSETGGLAVLLKVKVNARVMITTNIDLLDSLINGQIGTVKYISINQNEVNVIYVAFDDVSAGQIRINRDDLIARNNKWAYQKGRDINIHYCVEKNITSY